LTTEAHKIRFKGIVQGVGFRPSVFRTATSLGIKGWVLNQGASVEVVVDKDPEGFLKRLKEELPPLARIESADIGNIQLDAIPDFYIKNSSQGERDSMVPPDTAICDDCLDDLWDRNGRRHRYPFTNCTNCGARFSVIAALPYDRERTTMAEFVMCDDCKAEFRDPMDRRFHAQTVSCPLNGPEIFFQTRNEGVVARGNEAITRFAEILQDGGIGIIKLWGGMNAVCFPGQARVLRERLHRLQKPFAVMARDIDSAAGYVYLNDHETKLLSSPQRPIVLARKKKELGGIAPGLDTIGIYLPYSPISHLLFSELDTDLLVSTSANLPGEPMAISNENALKLDADGYLLHNRQVLNRCDDSLLVPFQDKAFFIRKSRGYVPFKMAIPGSETDSNVLGVGGHENVTISLSKEGYIYPSQYLGKSRYYGVQEFMDQALSYQQELLGVRKFDRAVVDLHPGYATRPWSEGLGIPEMIEVQHHWAHAAALMVDQGMDERIIVLALDGTGYGADGQSWGGEVLECDFTEFKRVGALSDIPLPGGEKAVREPLRLVFAAQKLLGRDGIVYPDAEAAILEKMLSNAGKTSSFGRLMDLASAYLGICESRTYDGEPAMKLEPLLRNAASKEDGIPDLELIISGSDLKRVDTLHLLDQFFDLPVNSESQIATAAWTLVRSALDGLIDIAFSLANEKNISKIGLTGGVTYNIPVVGHCVKRIEKMGLVPVLHGNIPNGDGGISIGQCAIGSRM